jgi:hypothetical protein
VSHKTQGITQMQAFNRHLCDPLCVLLNYCIIPTKLRSFRVCETRDPLQRHNASGLKFSEAKSVSKSVVEVQWGLQPCDVAGTMSCQVIDVYCRMGIETVRSTSSRTQHSSKHLPSLQCAGIASYVE